MTLAIAFGAPLWWYLDGTVGREMANRKALEFLTGYLIEQSLSVDNMFVFVMIFTYFAVPPELQRRVLMYGVLGAIIMRAGMILAGVWLVSEFAWILYLFGLFLLVTGIKMLVFVGGKMLVAPWFRMPVQWSLVIVGSIILISVVLSLRMSKPKVSRSVS